MGWDIPHVNNEDRAADSLILISTHEYVTMMKSALTILPDSHNIKDLLLQKNMAMVTVH